MKKEKDEYEIQDLHVHIQTIHPFDVQRFRTTSLVSWDIHRKVGFGGRGGGESSSGVTDQKGKSTGAHKSQIEGEY